MALPVNQIGPYQFIRLDGVPELPQEEAEAITRPGVPGTGFMKTGKRGKEFTLDSTADVPTWASAQQANLDYSSLANSNLVDVIFGGVNYAAVGIRFNVVGVKCKETKRLFNTVGGLAAGGALVTATWRLFAVKV